MKQSLASQIKINTLYASTFLHTTLWAFVTAQRQCGVGLNASIRGYMHYFDVNDLEFNALKHAYKRKNDEFRRNKKEISDDARVVFDVGPDEVDRVFSRMKNLLNSSGAK